MPKSLIDIDEMPDLDVPVAIAGSMRQSEVGGSICLEVVIGVAIYVSEG